MDYTIMSSHQAIYRGTLQYHLPAYNLSEFGKLLEVMQGVTGQKVCERA